MPRKLPFVTVRDPRDSIWQSTVERVARRGRAEAASRGVAKAPDEGLAQPDRLDRLVDAANAHVFEVYQAGAGRTSLSDGSSAPAPAFAVRGVLDSAKLCASLAYQLAKAKVFGTPEEVRAIENDLNFSTCDPFWGECVTEYVDHYRLFGGLAHRPIVANPLLSETIPPQAVVAILGDWGTGEPRAVEVLDQVKMFRPDILMHLGDVYYSGTEDEVRERFLDVVSRVFGPNPPRLFSLCGNHDMYAGGTGYYSLVKRIGQESTYFAIQNDHWRFVSMDTGLNDHDPLTVNSSATFLKDSDARWVREAVSGAGGRKVVLFSHHPPFSAYEPIADEPVNSKFLGQVQPVLPKVSAWFWGHEHRLGVYESHLGVARGRCVGHGAIPVFETADGEKIRFPEVPVLTVQGRPLPMGTEDGFYKNGFAIMTLDGSDARVRYYRSGESSALWEESF